MSKKVKFQDKWLLLKDTTGTAVSQWAQKNQNDLYSCFCKICPNVSIATDKGSAKLIQHSKTAKHIKNLHSLKSGQTLLLATPEAVSVTPELSEPTFIQPKVAPTQLLPSQTSVLKNSNCLNTNVALFNPKEYSTRAELYWCMETVVSCSSIASCAGKKELFQIMFPGSIPDNFSLSPSKAQYLITEALGPYFHKQMIRDIDKVDVLTCLLFDDTSNVKSKKEMQIRIRYWSQSENIIVCRHLATYFLGSATGTILFSHLEKSLDSNGLSLKKVLALGCDGPNVNKTVMTLFQEKLKMLKAKPLLDIGTCELHIVHNSFVKGCNCLSIDVSDFIVKVYYYFHHRDVRCEIFEKIQNDLSLPQHKFIQHISTRWLTVGPAAERVDEQLPALENYFLTYIPKNESSTLKKQNYIDIIKYLTDARLKSTLVFIVYASKIFTTEFTLIMQKEEPLIHILYGQLKLLILILLSSIIKGPILKSTSFVREKLTSLLKDKTNFLDLLEVNPGETVKGTVAALSQKEKLFFMSEVKEFYTAAVNHLLTKIKCFKTLKYFQCLSPENIKKPESVSYITKIGQLIPLSCIDTNKLECEWRLLQLDENVRFKLNKDERIDSYWSLIFSLQKHSNPSVRYQEIKRVVQNALALTHGNADVERGFSLSRRLLTEDKNRMTERTLNAKLAIADGLKNYNKMVHKVPITPELVRLAQKAYSSYQLYLENERRILKEQAEKKAAKTEVEAKEKALLESVEKEQNTIKKLEGDLKSAEKDFKNATLDAESMQDELNLAVKRNAKDIVVKELIHSLQKFRDKEKEKRQKVDGLQQNIRKRTTKMMQRIAKKRKV